MSNDDRLRQLFLGSFGGLSKQRRVPLAIRFR